MVYFYINFIDLQYVHAIMTIKESCIRQFHAKTTKEENSMNLRKTLALVLAACLVLSLSTAFAGSKWINVNGNNMKAHQYKGWAAKWNAPEAWLLMKWSKDWTPQADEPVGAWVTNHFTWYADEYTADTWYGWDVMTDFEEGAYRIEDFLKIMSVGDDSAAWAKYQAAGAYDAGWGRYADGVPRYIVLAEEITVYDSATGDVLEVHQFVKGIRQGLGQPCF